MQTIQNNRFRAEIDDHGIVKLDHQMFEKGLLIIKRHQDS